MKRSSRVFRHLSRMTFILLIILIAVQGNISVQAASKSVYVISKIVRNQTVDTNINKSGYVKYPYNVTYNKKGLITKVKSPGMIEYKYKYNNKNQFVKSEVTEFHKDTYEFELDKKGRVKMILGGNRTTFKYNSKGYLKSISAPYGNSYTYNSKGQLIKVRNPHTKWTLTYTYDSHGMFASEKEWYDGEDAKEYTYTNTYNKKGQLTKQIKYDVNEKKNDAIISFTYKKIKVPSSLVTRIKAQQRYLYREFGSYAWVYYPLEAMYK